LSKFVQFSNFIGFVADGVHGEEGECEAVEDGEKEEAYAGGKRGGGSTWNPGREPEHVQAKGSVKGQHVEKKEVNINVCT